MQAPLAAARASRGAETGGGVDEENGGGASLMKTKGSSLSSLAFARVSHWSTVDQGQGIATRTRAGDHAPHPLTPHPPISLPTRLSVSSALKKSIMAARLAKKMTQAQLAQAINEKPQIIQEYESGKAIPAPAVLSKLSRALGVVLSNKPKK